MEKLTNSSLQHYYNEIDPERMPDLEISCRTGKVFPAHRALLACHSPFLREVFLSDPINQEQEIVLHLPDFNPEDVEALVGFLYGKVPEISSAEDIFKSLAMDRPIVELEVEVTSNPLDATLEANPGELFGNYSGNYMGARDIETAEVFIDNNNYMVEEVCGESLLDWAELEEYQRGHTGVISDTLNITANVDLGETVSVDLSLGGNEQLMDGRKYSELFQEVNPDLCIENVECGGQNDVNSNPSHGSRYLCNFCSMVFTSLDDLHQHTSEDHQDLLGSLEDPSQGDQSPVNESSGFENTGANSPLLCGICKAGFEDFKLLSSHVSQHVSLGRLESGLPFLCKFCPPETCQFVEIDDLMRHTKVYHYKEVDHSASCPQCSRVFKNLRALKMHISTHSSIKPFQCGGCFGTYSSTVNLKIHFKNYCGANKIPHVRPQLAKLHNRPSLNDDANAKPHEPDGVDGEKKVDTSSTEKARRFTCQECGVVFRSRDLIRLHVTKCPAIKSKMLLHEAQVHLQGVEEKSCINLPNDAHKDSQQVSQDEDTAADVMPAEEDGPKMPSNSSHMITKVLYGKRGRPKKMALEICPDCGKSFRRSSSLHLHKCTPKISPQEKDDPNDDDDDDYGPTTRGRSNMSRFSKKSSPTTDRKPFKEEDRLEDYDWDGQDQVQTPISRAGSETTRSGRLIKRKRFFEPEPEIKKRLRRSTLTKGRSAEQEGSRCGPVRVSTACQICSEDQGSHMELFRHAVTHLEPGVDKTLPIYEDGETGWCPHCCEPVVVEFSEEHVLDKHPELVTPGAGPSRVILPELKDELSPHLSDEETRSVIKDPC